jgi:hypothetical protein
MKNRKAWLAAAGLSLACASCGGRSPDWDTSVQTSRAPLGARSSIVLLDAPAERAVMIAVDGDLKAIPVAVPIGRNLPSTGGAAITPDGARALVLCRGDVPRKSSKDQPPALFVLDSDEQRVSARYELSDPLSALTVDPESRFAIASAGLDDSTFVSNPNELIVVDLSQPPSAQNPVALTLRSFGGRPERVDFTPSLSLPGGKHRLLVVQTDRDLALLDLEDLSRPDITVKLTGGASAVSPAGFAVTDGDPATGDSARLAVRLQGDPNVVIVDFLPPAPDDASGVPFRPTPNIVGLAAPASDLAFLRTDGGLRLGALVPAAKELSLIEPATGAVAHVDLGASLEHIALVTEAAGGADTGGDVALLWSASSASIAFVALGNTVGKPYKSVQLVPLPEPVSAVLDVPAPRTDIKVLAGASGQRFFVLDLPSRTVSPLLARAGVDLTLSPDGQRVWVTQRNTPNLASIDFATIHPQNLLLDRPVGSVLDIARRDGGRALVVVHPQGSIGLSILDARNPSLLDAREYAAVLAGELP